MSPFGSRTTTFEHHDPPFEPTIAETPCNNTSQYCNDHAISHPASLSAMPTTVSEVDSTILIPRIDESGMYSHPDLKREVHQNWIMPDGNTRPCSASEQMLLHRPETMEAMLCPQLCSSLDLTKKKQHPRLDHPSADSRMTSTGPSARTCCTSHVSQHSGVELAQPCMYQRECPLESNDSVDSATGNDAIAQEPTGSCLPPEKEMARVPVLEQYTGPLVNLMTYQMVLESLVPNVSPRKVNLKTRVKKNTHVTAILAPPTVPSCYPPCATKWREILQALLSGSVSQDSSILDKAPTGTSSGHCTCVSTLR